MKCQIEVIKSTISNLFKMCGINHSIVEDNTSLVDTLNYFTLKKVTVPILVPHIKINCVQSKECFNRIALLGNSLAPVLHPVSSYNRINRARDIKTYLKFDIFTTVKWSITGFHWSIQCQSTRCHVMGVINACLCIYLRLVERRFKSGEK